MRGIRLKGADSGRNASVTVKRMSKARKETNAMENTMERTSMKWDDIISLFREYNKIYPNAKPLTAYIIYDASNWDKPYSETSRTYAVNSWSNLFFDGKISCSLFGDCMDMTDQRVRLDWYNWKRESCYVDATQLPNDWQKLIESYRDRMKAIQYVGEVEFDEIQAYR